MILHEVEVIILHFPLTFFIFNGYRSNRNTSDHTSDYGIYSKEKLSHFKIFEHTFLNPFLHGDKIIRVWLVTCTSTLFELLNVLCGADKQNAEDISNFYVVSDSLSLSVFIYNYN